MLKVGIKPEEGVFKPLYESVDKATFNFMAKSFKKLFKGNKEVMLNKKLQQSISEGYLTLRGFERALIGTGIEVEIPQGYVLQILTKKGLALKTGLLIADAPGVIDSAHKGEISLVVVNNTPFLSKIRLGDILAEGIIVKFQHASWENIGPPSLAETFNKEES